MTLYLVAYPVLTEVGGVILEPDGTRVAGPAQHPQASDLVAELAAQVPPNEDVQVCPGWDKAPEGLREAYRAKQDAARGPRTLYRIEEDERR